MAQLVKEFFGLNLLVMRILGFYPTQKYQCLYKLYTFAVYLMFTTLIPILSSLFLIVDPDTNLDKVADNAFIICQLGCFILKMIPVIVKSKEIRDMIYMIENPVFTQYMKEQEKIFNDCGKVCKRISRLFLNFCIACTVMWSISPILENESKLPINVWLPYNFRANSCIYTMSFVYVMAGTGNGAISNGALDPLIAGLAYYATCQIKILKANLEHLSNNVNRTDKDNSFQVYYQIKQCICHHSVILKFMENYEKLFSAIVFTQFFASVLVICICCFKLSQVSIFSITFIWMAIFLVTMLSEIFLYCFFGTTLSEESNSLTQAMYMGNWYEYDVRSRKILLILMERSKQPVVVKAGKILDLSLDTFTMILRRAYSLLAVLKNY